MLNLANATSGCNIVTLSTFSVTITPDPGQTIKGFLLKVVAQGETAAVGHFDTIPGFIREICEAVSGHVCTMLLPEIFKNSCFIYEFSQWLRTVIKTSSI